MSQTILLSTMPPRPWWHGACRGAWGHGVTYRRRGRPRPASSACRPSAVARPSVVPPLLGDVRVTFFLFLGDRFLQDEVAEFSGMLVGVGG